MVKYTTAQRVFLVECYLLKKKKPVEYSLRKFHKHFPSSKVPSRRYVQQLVHKWRSTGSVNNLKKQRRRTALTQERLEDIQARLQASPHTSLRRVAQETGISYSSARNARILLHLGSDPPHSEVCFSENMEEPVFIKCEPEWPSDTDEEPSNIEQNALPSSDNLVKIKEDPQAPIADPIPEEDDIKMVKEPCSDEIDIEETHDEEKDCSGGSSHEVENAGVVTGAAVHSCSICSKTFNHRSALKRHELTHNGEKEIRCKICNNTFAQHGHLKIHLLTHSKDKPFECSICGNTFIRSSDLARHQNSHVESRPFTCTICGNTFRRASDLSRHENAHGGSRPFTCTICGNTFSRTSDLRRHLNGHTDSRPFPCTVCGNAFRCPSDLRKHEKIHTTNRPFSCTTCGNTFRILSDLRKHEKIHTDNKPFSCSICDKNFRRLSHLKRHHETHTESKT